jgi:DNA-binding response OmpR family regulator
MKTLTEDTIMSDNHTQTVAVFDDDKSICKTVQLLVEQQGMVCVSANTIPQAAYEIGRSEPDIIIADFEFQCGFNLALLAESLAASKAQVFILTAGDPKDILKKYPDLAFAKFVKKGTNLHEVIEEISA